MSRAPKQFVEAFARLLAPPPLVVVFVDLEGIWYDALEMPETFRAVVGLSHQLYHEIVCEQIWETGKPVDERIELLRVKGREYTFLVPNRQQLMMATSGYDPRDVHKPQTMTLRPKIVADRDGAFSGTIRR